MSTGTNVTPFPHARDNNTGTCSDNNRQIYINNIYIRARAREETEQLVSSCYASQLGYWPTAAIMEQLRTMMNGGADASLLCAVLEYTAQSAPRPSWAYARTVLQKQIAAGVKDADGFNQACSAYRAARSAAAPAYTPGYYKPQVQEQRYEQRHYDPAEYDDIPEDQLAQMAEMR